MKLPRPGFRQVSWSWVLREGPKKSVFHLIAVSFPLFLAWIVGVACPSPSKAGPGMLNVANLHAELMAALRLAMPPAPGFSLRGDPHGLKSVARSCMDRRITLPVAIARDMVTHDDSSVHSSRKPH